MIIKTKHQSLKVDRELAKQDHLGMFSVQADAGNQVRPYSPSISIVGRTGVR